MVTALRRGLSCLPALPACPSPTRLLHNTLQVCKKSLSFVARNKTLILPSLLALGHDVYSGRPVFTSHSATAVITGVNLAFHALFKKYGARALSSLPNSLGLIVAIYYDNPNLLRELIRLGVDPNAKFIDDHIIHYAAFIGNEQAVDILLQAGVNINCQNSNQWTALHLAASKGNKEMVRFLLDRKADPFQGTTYPSPFLLAQNNPEILLLLLGAEKNPAFKKCKNLHDICNVLFSSSSSLISNWETIVEQIPPAANFQRFTQELQGLEKSRSFSAFTLCVIRRSDLPFDRRNFTSQGQMHAFCDNLPNLVPMNTIRDALIECNPSFAAAWRIANNPPITIQRTSDELVQYDPGSHTIKIPGSLKTTLRDFTQLLIYQTVCALQEDATAALEDKLKKGNVMREPSIIIRHWHAYLVNDAKGKILNSMFPQPIQPSSTFPEDWDETASDPKDIPDFGKITLIEFLRQDWNIRHFAAFFAKKKEILQNHIARLQTSFQTREKKE